MDLWHGRAVGSRTEDELRSLRAHLEAYPALSPRASRPRRKPSALAHALSGVIGAVLAEVVFFPVDTVKLLTQTAPAGQASGFFGILAGLLRDQGPMRLYKGLGASVLKESVHAFNFWLLHETIFRWVPKGDTSSTPTSLRLLLNLVTKQLNWLCTVPFEVISSVNQLADDSPGFFATAASLYSQSGISGFYRGLGISLVLAINPAIMNTLITTVLGCVAMARMACGQDYDAAREHGPSMVGLATGLSKFIATVLTYPLIRAKVLQQTSAAFRGRPPWEIWRQIWATEGTAGLYRGILAMSYKTVLWNTFSMMVKSRIGPKRMLTPPASPHPELANQPLPFMARDPVALDPITLEKLDEILEYIRWDKGNRAAQERMNALERTVQDALADMRDVKAMLRTLVAVSQPSGQSGTPARGPPQGLEETPSFGSSPLANLEDGTPCGHDACHAGR